MGNKKLKQSSRQRSKNLKEREHIKDYGYGFLNGKHIRLNTKYMGKIKELNKMNQIDYNNKFFKYKNSESLNEKSEKKVMEILRIKRNIDDKILELEHYDRQLSKELDLIDIQKEIVIEEVGNKL